MDIWVVDYLGILYGPFHSQKAALEWYQEAFKIKPGTFIPFNQLKIRQIMSTVS